MTVNEVAKMLGKNPQTIRVGIQQGIYPFGVCFKMPNSSTYNYTIYPQKVKEFINGE